MTATIPGRPRLRPLAQLRRRLSVWYVTTTAVILLALGGGLFFAVARQIGLQLDASLDRAVSELIRAERSPSSPAPAGAAGAVTRARDAAPRGAAGLELYLLDSTGAPLHPARTTTAVRTAAVEAIARGNAALELPGAPEHVVRIRARAFHTPSGALLVAAAAADLEDLEDSYTLLIWQFAVAALVAIALAALGGMWLARQSSAPIEAVVEHMQHFMADAAHELRTPVSILRTEAETAMDRERERESDQRTFAVMTHESRRLSTVVDDLFTLARAEAGEYPVDREPVVLDDLVSDAVAAAAERAGKKGIALELTEFEEARIIGSTILLSRLIGILLDNAIKYTAPRGRVTVAIGPTPAGVRLRVADTGIGIPADAMLRVYDRFFRADGARAMAGGAGLGLAIAKWITELHGGRIHIASVVGTGTTVTVEVPSRE